MAIKTSTGMAAPQLDNRTKLSHRSLDALTHPSGCCVSHKCHSMVVMARQIYPALLLHWFIIALLVLQTFLGRSIHQGYHPLIQATITCLSVAPRNAHSLYSPAHSLSQSYLTIPRHASTTERLIVLGTRTQCSVKRPHPPLLSS